MKAGMIGVALVGLCTPFAVAMPANISAKPPFVKPVTAPDIVRARTAQFQNKMHALGFGGRIQSCKGMVQLAVGIRGGDISYGAMCRIRTVANRPQDLLLCDDEMFGHFALTNTFTITQTEIARFTLQNCYGG